jgi:hypothetical protein
LRAFSGIEFFEKSKTVERESSCCGIAEEVFWRAFGALEGTAGRPDVVVGVNRLSAGSLYFSRNKVGGNLVGFSSLCGWRWRWRFW